MGVEEVTNHEVGNESINCAVCTIDATTKEHTLRCANCKNLFHQRCIKMQSKEYRAIISANEEWNCANCHQETLTVHEKLEKANWGDLKGQKLKEAVNSAYLEVVRWRRNLFDVPTGKVGQDFIDEVITLINHFNDGTAFEPIALTLVALIFPLLLQKPSANSKTKDHVRYLEKRLIQWKKGELEDLLHEGMAVQKRFSSKKKTRREKKEKKWNRFINLMEKGKISAALRSIGSEATGVLDINQVLEETKKDSLVPDMANQDLNCKKRTVLDELKDKHPAPKEADYSGIIKGEKQRVEDIIFEELDSQAIHSAAKKTKGAAGPSGADADLWRRILCSRQFKKKPSDLCSALAALARKLNTINVDPEYLRAFVAGRLIPLDKKPGVRPIGIGEVIRRIVSSATVTLFKPEIVEATAPLQTCAGLPGGIEASIHAMRRMWEDPETEAILLVDASNAFNSLNRQTALQNIDLTCPELATFLKNLYNCEAELFIANSDETVLSREGATQGGPESIAFYAVSTTPLAKRSENDAPAKKVFYADDGSGAGKLVDLEIWFRKLKVEGKALGYDVNDSKTWLLVKSEHAERAADLFPTLKITTEGRKYLGSFIGNADATRKFIEDQIELWKKDINDLTEIAKFEPQLAYCAYVFGTSQRWKFVCRTTPDISVHMQELEDLIKESLLPALIGGRTITDTMRQIYSLPTRMGGLGISIPSKEANIEYVNSKEFTEQLASAIFNQENRYIVDDEKRSEATTNVRKRKEEYYKDLLYEMNLSETLSKTLKLSSEKGASIWLTSLPLKQFGFRLNKQQFEDAICMRYNLQMKEVPRRCICGDEYSMNHCLTCKNGGYVIIRHNAVRDTAHEVLKEVCNDVRLEPALLPVTGEELPPGTNVTDGARADVSALGFWQPLNRAFFDVKVINPFAQSNWSKKIEDMYKFHESLKKKEYNARILEVEKGSFSPLVFTCTGGAGPEATKFIKRLALKYSEKKMERYSDVVSFLRRRFRFDILKTCVISFRGERSRRGLSETPEPVVELDIELTPMEL